MPRPFNRRQALENAAFLEALRRTGNARLAADALGVHRSTYSKRRASHPAFAAEWDAALAFAHAQLEILPEPGGRGTIRQSRMVEGRRSEVEPLRNHRTTGGEPHLVRTASGRLQLRRAAPGRMTPAAEQAFFAALSATANVRVAAAAAGFAHSSFYARRRSSRAFAREMRLALETGYDRLELALLAASDPASHRDDGWRHNDPPPIPPMSASEALQLLYLHQKHVRLSWDQPHRKRRRGEPDHLYVERLRAMWACEKACEAEDRAVACAQRYERTGDRRLPNEPPPPALPRLDLLLDDLRRKHAQRTRPERAEGRQPGNPDRALFGGWRIDDWKKR